MITSKQAQIGTEYISNMVNISTFLIVVLVFDANAY